MTKCMKWNLIPIAGVVISLLIAAPCSAAREETVSLTFRTSAAAEEGGFFYTVKAGDSMSEIIHDEFGVSYGEIYRILDLVREINPQIKDINIIHTGQKIRLPGRGKSPDTDSSRNTPPESTSPPEKGPHLLTYTVQRGDTVSRIIHTTLGIAYSDMKATLEEVKRLNPHIRDLNIVQPGDVITLPGYGTTSPAGADASEKEGLLAAAKDKEPPEKPAVQERPFLDVEQEIDAIDRVVGRMHGSVIREGTFYIPLPPAGQMSVDCARVPIVEFDEGMTMLLDFSNRVPDNLKQIIESKWKNYVIVRRKPDSDTPSMLEGVIEASRSYKLHRIEGYRTVGQSSLVNILVDWIVSHNDSDSFAINLLDNGSSLLHKNILNYTDSKGLEIIEVLQGRGIVRMAAALPPRAPTTLTYKTKRQLAESVLTVLGHASVRDASIRIFDIERDGFNLSIKADLSLSIDGRDILVVFQKIPRQFLDILESRGTIIATLSEEMEKEAIVTRVLETVKAPFLQETFPFTLAEGRGKILLPAIRTRSEEGFLYFIDYDIDSDIYGLLYEKWEVDAVRY